MADDHGWDGGTQLSLPTVVTVVEESRYGGLEPAPGILADPVREFRDALAAATPLGWRRRLLPPSVVAGLPRVRRGGRDGQSP
jgi:hypothetical protein